MFSRFISRNIDTLEAKLFNFQDCNLYCDHCKRTLSETEILMKIESFRKKNDFLLKDISFSIRDRITLNFLFFAIRMNAKFRFRKLRFIMEIIHTYLEALRLANNETKINMSLALVELDYYYPQESNTYLFYPSFKKFVQNVSVGTLNIVSILRLVRNNTYMEEYKKSSRNVWYYILYVPMLLISSFFHKWREERSSLVICTNGSMNLFNRMLARVALHYHFDVLQKDHGFVRDCVAEYGIFSKASGYANQAGAKHEE